VAREARRAARIAAAIAALSAAVVRAPLARAGTDAPASAPVGKGYVQLDVTARAEDASALADTLRELIARLGLDLHDGPGAPAAAVGQGERARVTVTETTDRADIAISEVRDGRLGAAATRTLPKNESNAIETEQIAHVAYAALESMFATDQQEAPASASGSAAASAPAPAPAPAVAPAPTPAPPRAPQPPAEPAPTPASLPDQVPSPAPASGSRPSVAAMVFAAGSGVATSSGAVLGGGGEARLSLGRGFAHPSFWVQGATAATFAEQTADVTVETNVTSLRGGADLALVSTGLVGVHAGAGAGADVFHTVPAHGSPGVALEPTVDLVDPIVTARVLGGIRLPGGVRAIAGVDLDVDLAAHRYVTVLASGAHAGVYTPWAARPTVLLGVCVPLLGREGCVP
jgi:hypothetical protein